MLNQIESFDNLIPYVVDALKCCTPLSNDVMAYCIVNQVTYCHPHTPSSLPTLSTHSIRTPYTLRITPSSLPTHSLHSPRTPYALLPYSHTLLTHSLHTPHALSTILSSHFHSHCVYQPPLIITPPSSPSPRTIARP